MAIRESFNVDPGIRAPNFQTPSAGSGGSGSYSGVGDGLKNLGGLFDGIAANANAKTEAEIALKSNQAYDRTMQLTQEQVQPIAQDATAPNAAANTDGSPTSGGETPAGVTASMDKTQRLQEAYRQGKLTRTAFYSALNSELRQIKVQYPGYADKVNAIAQKALGFNPQKEQVDSFFKEQDEQEKALKEQDQRWDKTKSDAAALGIPGNVLVLGDTDPSARKRVQVEVYNRQAQNATIEKRKQQLELRTKEQSARQDEAYNLALDTVDTDLNNIFTDAFASTVGFSFNDILKKSRAALADNTVSNEEAAEITKMFSMFKEQANLRYANTMATPFGEDKRSFNARIGDKSKLDNIKNTFDQRLAILEDSLTNKQYGILSWNKAMIESISEGDQLTLLRNGDTFRTIKALKETGGDTAVNTWLTENMGKLKQATDGVKLGTIATGVVAGKPMGQVLNENKGSDQQASGILADTTMKQATKILLDPKSTPEVIMNTAESLFGAGNRDFMSQFNTASKSKVFDIVASPAMTERMIKLGKDNPKALKTYSDWAVASFGNIFKDAADTLKNHVTSSGPIGTLGTGIYNKQSPVTFDGKYFQINPGLDHSGQPVSLPSSLSAQYSAEAIQRINGALKNLYPILEASGQDPMSALNTLFANANIDGEARDMLQATIQSFYQGGLNEDQLNTGNPVKEGMAAKGMTPGRPPGSPGSPSPSGGEADTGQQDTSGTDADVPNPVDNTKRVSELRADADYYEKTNPSAAQFFRDQADALERGGNTPLSNGTADLKPQESPKAASATPVQANTQTAAGEAPRPSERPSKGVVQSTGRASPTGVTYNPDGTANAAPRDAVRESMQAYLDERASAAERPYIESQLRREQAVNAQSNGNYGIKFRPNKKAQAEFNSRSPKDYGEGTVGLLNFIGDKEAGGDYNNYYGRGKNGERVNLASMTIKEVLDWQRQRVNNGSPSSATGKYQFMQKTLAGLKRQLQIPDDTKFTPDLQDRLAYRLLEQRGLSRFVSGQIDEDTFINNLAQEWAGLPRTNGVSHYAGDGLNKALTSTAEVKRVLKSLVKEQKKTDGQVVALKGGTSGSDSDVDGSSGGTLDLSISDPSSNETAYRDFLKGYRLSDNVEDRRGVSEEEYLDHLAALARNGSGRTGKGDLEDMRKRQERLPAKKKK